MRGVAVLGGAREGRPPLGGGAAVAGAAVLTDLPPYRKKRQNQLQNISSTFCHAPRARRNALVELTTNKTFRKVTSPGVAYVTAGC